MLKQAEKETEKALRFDIKHNTRAFVNWLSGPATAKVGVLHRLTKPQTRHEDEYVHTHGKACCPRTITDAKTGEIKAVGPPHHRTRVLHLVGQPGSGARDGGADEGMGPRGPGLLAAQLPRPWQRR
eukprot:766056-Pyramimonas_sp.AAC.1